MYKESQAHFRIAPSFQWTPRVPSVEWKVNVIATAKAGSEVQQNIDTHTHIHTYVMTCDSMSSAFREGKPACVNLEDIVLSETRQTQKDTDFMVSLDLESRTAGHRAEGGRGSQGSGVGNGTWG